MPVPSVLLMAATVDDELAEVCGERPSWSCEVVWNVTGSRVLARGADWFISRPLAAGMVLLVAWIVNRWLRRAVSSGVDRFTKSSRFATSALSKIGGAPDPELVAADARQVARAVTLSAVSRATVSWVVWSIAALMVLGIFEIQLAPLIAGAGIVAVAVGLGAQSFVKDCFAGFFMIMEDQCGVGDDVDLGHAAGIVEAISLRSLRIRGADGTLWTVPAGAIIRVGNHSRAWSQGLVDVTVPSTTDVDEAIAAFDEACDQMRDDEEHASVLLGRPTLMGIERFDPAGVVYRLSIKTVPGEHWKAMRAFRLAIVRALDAHGIHPAPAP
ncbi:MAG TPA: mechanosensitive ion channel family protein [Ilumatobacteraceae bacterium]|nr:mechanosensitive ion channel family protein [Ilumatobacteraceae bacterium]